MKKTKIICTLGPATDHKEILVDLIRSGMDVARFNFSHGTHEECAGRISLLKEAVKETGRTIGFMGDTKGPEMRLGIFKNGKIVLKPGQSFVLTTENIEGTEERSYVNYSELPKDIHEGDMILLNDGKQSLKVDRLTDTEIFTTVVSGGEVSSRKRVAVPGAILKLPFMSEADVSDITFAAEQGMDYLAASFVRNADDVMQIKRLLEKLHSSMGIIAKIENQEGVDNIDDIIEVADGVMIGRAALGRPWLPGRVQAFLSEGRDPGDPAPEERGRIMLDHLRRHVAFYGEKPGVRSFRKHLRWYLAELPGGEEAASALIRLEDSKSLGKALTFFFEQAS